MNLILKKPLYFKGAVLLEGSPMVTNEQHARELLRMGYATEQKPKEVEEQKPKTRKKAD